ncbi:hypothetical protein TNIN_344221 [Trichonephila inaurata madagascariensis]|uniref:Uncharacterized protein n=1 Tax=Trichonephila inaurata madagascariensis TaxID=2747483 RepID=A0A8X7CNV3_9ARAC|nr:hypothetical protein TNIN_344221 [Trichonephila inaurata madagascariensis]
MHSNVSHTIDSIAPYAPDDDPELADLYSRQAYLDQRRLQAPRKGTNTTQNNYSTAVDNLIRPNTSYAQAAGIKTT